MNRYAQLLRRRDFALLWGGATVSALGDGMSFIALVWLLIERGGTPADVGWLAATYTAPVVIGGLAAGVISTASIRGWCSPRTAQSAGWRSQASRLQRRWAS